MRKVIDHMFHIIFGMFFIALTLSCGSVDDNPMPISNDEDYFPMEKGRFIDYSYYTKAFSLVPDPDGSGLVLDSFENTTLIRQIFLNRSVDIENDSVWRLGFFSKDSVQQIWPIQPDSVAVVKLKENQIIYTINNRTYVKLQFPLKEGNRWNGNDFNSLPELQYEVVRKGSPLYIDTLVYTEGLEIIQSDQENLIEVNKQSEYYALNIGLALKKSTILQYQTNGGMVGSREIENGLITELKIIGNGKIE